MNLVKGIELTLPNYPYFISKFRFRISPDNPLESLYGPLRDPGFIYTDKQRSYLVLDVDFDESDRARILDESDDFWSSDDGNKTFAVEYSVMDLLQNIAKNLIVCLTIAKPGSIFTHTGYARCGENRHNFSSFTSIVTRAPYVEEEHTLRLLRDLPFPNIWNWYSSLRGVLTGRPENSVEVAVCNFISLFDENPDTSGARDLIWSFAGLESLLAESESGIVSQLRQKLVAIFGNQVDLKDFEKKIKEMYQIRSNIIHGKVNDIPTIQGHLFEETSYQPRQNQKRAAELAMYLLIAVIQYCCQNDLTNIKFKTVVV